MGISYQGKIHTAALSAAKGSQRGTKRKSGGKYPRPFDFKPFPGSKEVHIVDFDLEDEFEAEVKADEGVPTKKKRGVGEDEEKTVENGLGLFMKTRKKDGVQKRAKKPAAHKAEEKVDRQKKENVALKKSATEKRKPSNKKTLFSPPLPRVPRKKN